MFLLEWTTKNAFDLKTTPPDPISSQSWAMTRVCGTTNETGPQMKKRSQSKEQEWGWGGVGNSKATQM